MTEYRGPGEGAEEVASRAALRAERLRREREIAGATDSAAEAELERALRTQKNWSQGAEGERLVAYTLGALERYGWLLLHDIRWPGRQKANIDHVAIGPGGVVVIDTKNWSGDVAVTDGVLRCAGYSKTKECDSIALQAADVTALLRPEQRSSVRGVMALAAHDTEPTPAGPIIVMGREHLGPWLLALPARLNPYDVVDIAIQLRQDHSPRAERARARQQKQQSKPPRQRSRGPQAVRPAYRGPAAKMKRSRKTGTAVKIVLWLLAVLVGLPAFINYGPAIGEFIGTVIGQVIGAVPAPTSTG
ncbi:nuclease-related domain-containing protein [Flavimobilis soli]|uniref:nuclease-related domain-containing protein n=1 Tax=Flavimobilis soli TaxID=442709 RepID=UPI00147638CE|nr:nuclease-related domain-containing protein [Flavimobilis soli]